MRAFGKVGIIAGAVAEDRGGDGVGGDRLAILAGRAVGMVLEGVSEREKIGLVVGTTLGCLETDREFDRSRREAEGRYASPAAFSRTLPSTIAAEMALRFGLRGPSLVVSAGAESTAVALRRGMRWMGHFGLEYCVVAGMDWRGEGVGEEGCFVAAVLLGRERGAMLTADRSGFESGGLGAGADESLRRLGAWVRERRSMGLRAGVSVRM